MPAPRPEPRWDLPDNPSLDWLRGRAKQLQRVVADPHAERHGEALDMVTTYDPPASDGPIPLARAQRVLARAFGFAGWSKLREHLAVIEEYARPMDAEHPGDGPVDTFLRLACLSYTEPDVAERGVTLLADDPGLATASVHTMAATGRSQELAAALATDPGAVSRQGGPHRWEPLLYLAYSRLGLADPAAGGDPVTTLRVLLDAGADPDAGCLWKGLTSPFTALTGVLGGGERGEPPHPDGVVLATLLLDAGADPNDNQAFYNRMFEPDDSHLGPLLAHGAGREHPSPWRERLGSAYPSPQEMVGEHLRSAAEYGFSDRVRTLLAHDVDPNTVGYHPILGDQTAYEIAVRNGHREAADLLATAGGRSDRIDEVDLLLSASFAGDSEAVARLRGLEDVPTQRPDAMRLAGEQHDVAALALLLDLGYDVSAAGRWSSTALHEAALRGDVVTCRWLVAHGADRGAEDERFSSTPAGWAAHAGHDALAEEIADPGPATG